MVADKYCELADTVPKAIVESEMTAALVKFLKDSEPEVRTAAAFKVTGFCERISVDVTLQHLMPCARDLAVDSSQHVRAALASVTFPSTINHILETSQNSPHVMSPDPQLFDSRWLKMWC
jgi:hypothetical protein